MDKMTDSEKRSLDTGEIAKRIRAQLKNDFAGCTFSVTIERYSGGSSVNIDLMKADIKVVKDIKDIDMNRVNPEILDRHTEDSIRLLQESKYHQLNQYSFNDEYNQRHWCNGVFLTEAGHNMLKKAVAIADAYNYDNSDAMTDYFDVNFYLHINLGKWNKDFVDGAAEAI